MPNTDPTAALLQMSALFIAVGGLLIAFARSRLKKEEIDTQALQMTIQLAKKTPELEAQLHDTMQQLSAAQTEAKLHKEKITEMEQTIRQQAEEIQQLKAENAHLSAQLKDLRDAMHILQAQRS